MPNQSGGYSFVDIAQGKPEQDKQEREARLAQLREGTIRAKQENEERELNLRKRRQLAEPGGADDKDVQRQGLLADFNLIEQQGKAFRQPGQERVMDVEQRGVEMDSKMRATAIMFGAFKAGFKDDALEMVNKDLLAKGAQFSDMSVEDDPEIKDANGKPVKMFVMTQKGKDAKPIRLPLEQMERNWQAFGAQYKVVGNGLVRIGRNGEATPLYEPDQFVPNQDSPTGTSSKRTGLPPAAMGVRQPAPSAAPRAPVAAMGTGLPPAGTTFLQPGQQPPAAIGVAPAAAQTPDQLDVAPPLTRRQQTHVDTRVTHATAVINKYFGISEFTGLDPKNQPKYIAIVNRASQLVRNGQPPETAANTAIGEAVRAEKLQAAPGNPGAGTYTGPAPWRQ